MPVPFKAMSRRRWLILAASLLIVWTLPFLGIQVYYGNARLPQTVFLHGKARHFCTKCGSHAVTQMTTLFDGFQLNTPHPVVVWSPGIQGVDPTSCKHSFIIIAASDRTIDFPSLRFNQWGFGKLEGDPLWSSPALVTSFAYLSRSNIEDSIQLFCHLVALQTRGGLTGSLLDTVTGTNADAIFPILYQTFTNGGSVLPSQRNKKH